MNFQNSQGDDVPSPDAPSVPSEAHAHHDHFPVQLLTTAATVSKETAIALLIFNLVAVGFLVIIKRKLLDKFECHSLNNNLFS
ncbi:7413_t:CDS:2 [Entrophospora sp. SA101]|nr:15807_t:CDS:2 [Entrophospora sp. SA101]CAJ0745996.1 15996_t:CDS:2 [Entrophospora sp. SA101]CAJ0750158.1 7413_t:CDS:2 [Entrophospora sp. SA101]CAJ0839885.1 11398_t:CDS:2 [Entrophospora sp. SA101]CAJ0865041.1 21534_t:CDS:2 [Entrophospora sp. SA101]